MKQAAKLINPFLLLAIFASLVMLSCSSCGGKSGGAKPADDATFKKSNLPIFPLATGFGAFTFAGSGRNLSSPETTIYRVSTLNASGEGSLNSCVQASGPRVCVFEVSGTIILSDDLTVADPFLTIAGQTAPNPGITIRGGGLRIKTHDVLVQHVSIRVGDSIIGSRPDMRDGVGIVGDAGAFNIVIDHCSISWALDENFDAYYEKAFAITVSNSIISEGLLDSIHKKGPHSMGALIGDGVNDITFYRSLIANNRERNPYLKPGVVVELVNNVFYNWGKGQWQGTDISDYDKTGRDSSIHIVGNYYKPGPETGDTPPLFG